MDLSEQQARAVSSHPSCCFDDNASLYRCTIDGVYLLIKYTEPEDWDQETYDERAREAKQEALAEWEESQKEETEDSQSFLERLGVTVMRNLQLLITNVHIRYERSPGKGSEGGKHQALGVTLAALRADTCDEHWAVRFMEDLKRPIFKMVQLQELAVYIDPDAPALDGTLRKVSTSLQAMIGSTEVRPGLKHLVAPISGQLHSVVQNKSCPATGEPRLCASVKVAWKDRHTMLVACTGSKGQGRVSV